MSKGQVTSIIRFDGKTYVPVKYGIPRVGEDYIGLNGVVTRLISLTQAGNMTPIGMGGPVRLIVREIDKVAKAKAKLDVSAAVR